MTEKREVNKFNFKFENTYIDLPNSFYSEINLSPVIRPELIVFNKSLGNSLGLNSEELKSKEGLEILAGNKKIENGEYIAQAYGGHQFGHFNMLGDGRALLIGEQKTNELLNITGKPSDKFDIQLKGSGRTPYSRGGDGRAEDDNQCGDCFCTPAWKFFYGSLSKGGSCIVSDETCG